MASALQKLFRKRLVRQQQQQQQQQEQQQQQQQQNDQSKSGNRQSKSKNADNKQPIDGNILRPSFTINGFHSASSTSVHQFSASTSSSAFTNTSRSEQTQLPPGNERGYSFDVVQSGDRFTGHNRLRTSSLGASVMLRDRSTGSRSWRDSILPDSHASATVDQFGTMMYEDSQERFDLHLSDQAQRQQEEEEEDLENNAIYGAILERMTCTPKWAMAKVLLIPRNAVLRVSKVSEEELCSDAYISLHALTASRLYKDQFESLKLPVPQMDVSEDPWDRISLSTTFELESQTVHITLTREANSESQNPKLLKRSLKVISETNVYHTIQTQSNYQDSLPHKNRVRLRVLTVDGMIAPKSLITSKSKRSPNSAISNTRTTTTIKTAGDEKMDEDRASSVTFPTKDSRAETVIGEDKKSDSCLIPLSRQFLSDYAFLLDPPQSTGPLRGPLKCALDTLERASAEFANAYVYVPGFDSYNVSRIRRGILARSWTAFQQARKANGDCERGREGVLDLISWLGADARARLLLLLENVVMGYCHSKVYGSICSVRHSADEAFDSIIATYHDCGISLSDLGITRKGIRLETYDLHLAEAILSCLGDADEDMEYIMMDKNVAKIKQMAEMGKLPTISDLFDNGSFHSTQKNRCRIRTPLDSLEVLHATLIEINNAAVQSSRRQNANGDNSTLGADDLLPILAYVLIRVAPRKLTSLLYYVRLFGISDVTFSRQTWTLTTFEAVVRYLADDPLNLSNGSEALHLQKLHQAPSIGSAQSSLRSPTPSIASVSNFTRMEQSTSHQSSTHDRARRSSLPSSAMMNVQITKQSSENDAKKTKNYSRSKTFSSASSVVSHDGGMLSADEGDTTLQAFKMPGQPASAHTDLSGNHSRRSIRSIQQRDDKMDATSDKAKSYSTDGMSLHKRTLSASSDLVIRPQIVMRAPSQKVHESTKSKTDRPISPQDGSVSSRGASPDFAPNAPQLERRRKSIDSWTSLSFLHGNTSRSEMSRQSSAVAVTEEDAKIVPRLDKDEQLMIGNFLDPTKASARSVGPIDRNRSTSWLPSWTSEWALTSRRPSLDPSQQSHSGSQDDSKGSENFGNRSVLNQEQSNGPQTDHSDSSIVERSASNQSIPVLGFPSLDSMPSLEPHEGAFLSSENDAATMASSPRDRTSVLSSPSSIFSGASTSLNHHHQDQATIRGSRGSWYMNDMLSSSSLGKTANINPLHLTGPSPKIERRKGKSRSRLLSTSSPTDPLPPTLTTTDAAQALPNLFFSQARISSTDEIQRRTTTQTSKRPRPSSIASADTIPSVTLSPPLLNSRSKSSDQKDISGYSHIIGNTSSSNDLHLSTGKVVSPVSAYSSPPIQFIKLDIPSPVDERTDPISTTLTPNN